QTAVKPPPTPGVENTMQAEEPWLGIPSVPTAPVQVYAAPTAPVTAPHAAACTPDRSVENTANGVWPTVAPAGIVVLSVKVKLPVFVTVPVTAPVTWHWPPIWVA